MAQPKTPKTRMNDSVRSAAVMALLHHAVLDRALAITARSDALATRVMQEMLGPDGLKLLKKIPDGWLSKKDGMYNLNAGGWNVDLKFFKPLSPAEAKEFLVSGHRYQSLPYYLPFREVAVPSAINRDANGNYIVKDAALAAEIQAFVQALRAFHEQASALFNQINSTIQGFRYLEALLEAIPDLNTLAPDLKRKAIPPENALVPTAERLMCEIAKIRGDERDGCCDGERIADKPANDETATAEAA